MSRPGPDVLAVALAGALVAAWVGGSWVTDLARVALGLGVVALLLTRGRTPEVPWAREPRVVLTIAGLAAAALVAALSGRWLLGKTGVDFAVVSQLADSVTRRGALESCIPRGEWSPFLLHHFTPAFFAVGALCVSGLSAPWAVILSGALALGLSVLALWKLGRAWGSERAAAWLCLLWVLHPATRVGLGWSVHDETLALPGLAFALLALERRRWAMLVACALWVGACKESLLAVGACLLLVGAWQAWRSERRAALWLLAFAAVLGLGTLTYFALQPLLFHKQFDHLDKLTWRGPWWEVLGGKFLWLTGVYAPVLLTLLARRRPWWPPLLVVTPLIALVTVSGFEEMWKPFNYYALLPSFAATVSAAHGFVQAPVKQPRLWWAVAVMACLSWGGSLGPFLYPVLRGRRPDARALEALAPELRVYAVVGALPHVLHTARPLPWDPSQPVARDADVLVLTDTDPLPDWGHDCGASRGWRVRCR